MIKANPISVDHALDILGTLEGEYVWGPERVLGEILSLQFGVPHLRIYQPIRMPAGPSASHALLRYAGARGKGNLYIEDGVWTVTANGFTCGRFDPDLADDVKCLHALRGQILTDVSWIAERREWRFAFDLGGVVTITMPRPEDETPNSSEWNLFRHGAPTLSCIRDGTLELDEAVGEPRT